MRSTTATPAGNAVAQRQGPAVTCSFVDVQTEKRSLSRGGLLADVALPLIGRGLTRDDDGERPAGRVHIVRAAVSTTARAFAFDEPSCRTGVSRDVLLRRWHSTPVSGAHPSKEEP